MDSYKIGQQKKFTFSDLIEKNTQRKRTKNERYVIMQERTPSKNQHRVWA